MLRTEKLVGRANMLVFAGLALFIALFGVLTRDRMLSALRQRHLTQESYAVVDIIKDLRIVLQDARTGQRGFLLTGRTIDLGSYYAAVGRIPTLQAALGRWAGSDAVSQVRLHELAPLVDDELTGLGRAIALRRELGRDAAVAMVDSDAHRDRASRIDATLSDLLARQQTVLQQRMQSLDRRGLVVRQLTVAGIGLAALALLGAAWLLNQAGLRANRLAAEQRELAGRLRTSLDSISQGIGVFDTDLTLVEWNHCFQVLLTLPASLLVEGATYAQIAEALTAGDTSLLETPAQIAQSRQAGSPQSDSDWIAYERVTADRRHLELRRTPTADGGFVLAVSDMSKHVHAEAVVREAQKMQAIGQLTGGIAHDFNNLLTVILGNLEFARAKLGPDQGGLQTRLDRAVWAAQRGATLTSQLLSFARRQPLAPRAIALSATLPEMIPLLGRTLGEHIEVRFIDVPGLWPAMADAAQLESAVLNLALNARDAMVGGGRLTIELANKVLDSDYARRHADVAAGDYTMVAVSDSGHGMTPEVVARAFEPFYTTKPDGKGTGLGLAMVYGFVKQTGGHVEITSEPGQGTSVRLYLPRAIGLAAAPPRPDRPAQVPRGSATVLLVEDEAAVREIAVTILRDLGYRVLEAADGEEALQVFEAEAAGIDLLLTDVVLPGKLRGRDIAERVVAARPAIQVLYMSGYTEDAISHQGRLDDGVHLISKPFQRDQLAQMVCMVLAATTPQAPRSNVVGMRDRRES